MRFKTNESMNMKKFVQGDVSEISPAKPTFKITSIASEKKGRNAALA